MPLKTLFVVLFVFALLMAGCIKESSPYDESVKEGEARSVFVRNTSKIPMTLVVEINGLPYETVELEENQTVIYYEPLPVGLPRERVESYKIDGKLINNFGRSYDANGIEFSLDAYSYYPTGWSNSKLTPTYRFSEPIAEWLEEIDAVARKVQDLESVYVVASPSENTEKKVGEPIASEQRH